MLGLVLERHPEVRWEVPYVHCNDHVGTSSDSRRKRVSVLWIGESQPVDEILITRQERTPAMLVSSAFGFVPVFHATDRDDCEAVRLSFTIRSCIGPPLLKWDAPQTPCLLGDAGFRFRRGGLPLMVDWSLFTHQAAPPSKQAKPFEAAEMPRGRREELWACTR